MFTWLWRPRPVFLILILVLIVVLIIALTSGCTKPRLDTTNAERFRASVMAVRDKLPADARAAFDAALSALIAGGDAGDGAGDGASDPPPPLSDTSPRLDRPNQRLPIPALDQLSPALRQQLQGRTGREVIAIAAKGAEQRAANRQRAAALARERERRQLLDDIRTLRAKLSGLELETLQGLTVTRAQLLLDERAEDDTSLVRDWFDVSDLDPDQALATASDDRSALPTIELEITSQVRNGIYALLFEVELFPIDSTEPWRRFQIKQRFSRGLFYGQSATRRFVPKQFAELFGADAVETPPDPGSLVMVVRPVRLFGANGQAFAGADISDAELAQLQMLINKLNQSVALQTPEADQPARLPTTTSALDEAIAAEVKALGAWRDASIARAFKAEAAGIRAEQRAAEAAREPLSRFFVEQAAFHWSESQIHRKPIIELRVHNNTGETISWCHCRGQLTSPERDRPWVDAPLEHHLRDDLAPGEKRDLRIVPNWLGPWGGGPKDRDDLKLEIEITQLIGQGRKPLFVYDFPEEKTARLKKLEAFIATQGW